MNTVTGKVAVTSLDAHWIGNDTYSTADKRFVIHLDVGCNYTMTTEVAVDLIPNRFWLKGGPLDGCYT